LLSLGNFDGVHRGHVALVARLQAAARERGLPAIAVTFDPHPLQLLRPEVFEPLLTTCPDRCQLLEATGADHVVVLQTEPDLLRLAPREFFTQVIQSRLAARGLVEGPNFHFGRNREGNIDVLAGFCAEAGLSFEVMPPLVVDDTMISSSRIRQALAAGLVAMANGWLGRPYRLKGMVIQGARRGQQLGFPTANLGEIQTLIPGDGVYAGRAYLMSGTGASETAWPAAVNIGPNPTFGEGGRKVEAHLLGFHGELYGQPLAVELLGRLRDTTRFVSPEALAKQLRLDIARVEEIAKGGEQP
jgi:riboflavin kinase/FMN adenylyltransferase